MIPPVTSQDYVCHFLFCCSTRKDVKLMAKFVSREKISKKVRKEMTLIP